MGKIKSKQVKRTAHSIEEKGIEFSESFNENKKILGREMPSKKMRNQIAGHLTRKKKQERIAKAKLQLKE